MSTKHLITAILITAMLGLGVYCSSTQADKVVGGEEVEGWRKLANGDDAFFMRISGSASKKAKRSGEEAQKKVTCIESTKLQAYDNIVRKMIGEQVKAISGVSDGETTGFMISSMRKGTVKGIQLKECASLEDDWAQCECVHYASGPNLKQKFSLEVKRLAKEQGL